MNATIRNTISEHAVSIWLKADLEVLIERVSRRDTRPLLKKGDKKTIMAKLMDERYPVYATAEVVINSNEDSHESVVELLLAGLRGKGMIA